jgi:hypothetical protein
VIDYKEIQSIGMKFHDHMRIYSGSTVDPDITGDILIVLGVSMGTCMADECM